MLNLAYLLLCFAFISINAQEVKPEMDVHLNSAAVKNVINLHVSVNAFIGEYVIDEDRVVAKRCGTYPIYDLRRFKLDAESCLKNSRRLRSLVSNVEIDVYCGKDSDSTLNADLSINFFSNIVIRSMRTLIGEIEKCIDQVHSFSKPQLVSMDRNPSAEYMVNGLTYRGVNTDDYRKTTFTNCRYQVINSIIKLNNTSCQRITKTKPPTIFNSGKTDLEIATKIGEITSSGVCEEGIYDIKDFEEKFQTCLENMKIGIVSSLLNSPCSVGNTDSDAKADIYLTVEVSHQNLPIQINRITNAIEVCSSRNIRFITDGTARYQRNIYSVSGSLFDFRRTQKKFLLTTFTNCLFVADNMNPMEKNCTNNKLVDVDYKQKPMEGGILMIKSQFGTATNGAGQSSTASITCNSQIYEFRGFQEDLKTCLNFKPFIGRFLKDFKFTILCTNTGTTDEANLYFIATFYAPDKQLNLEDLLSTTNDCIQESTTFRGFPQSSSMQLSLSLEYTVTGKVYEFNETTRRYTKNEYDSCIFTPGLTDPADTSCISTETNLRSLAPDRYDEIFLYYDAKVLNLAKNPISDICDDTGIWDPLVQKYREILSRNFYDVSVASHFDCSNVTNEAIVSLTLTIRSLFSSGSYENVISQINEDISFEEISNNYIIDPNITVSTERGNDLVIGEMYEFNDGTNQYSRTKINQCEFSLLNNAFVNTSSCLLTDSPSSSKETSLNLDAKSLFLSIPLGNFSGAFINQTCDYLPTDFFILPSGQILDTLYEHLIGCFDASVLLWYSAIDAQIIPDCSNFITSSSVNTFISVLYEFYNNLPVNILAKEIQACVKAFKQLPIQNFVADSSNVVKVNGYILKNNPNKRNFIYQEFDSCFIDDSSSFTNAAQCIKNQNQTNFMQNPFRSTYLQIATQIGTLSSNTTNCDGTQSTVQLSQNFRSCIESKWGRVVEFQINNICGTEIEIWVDYQLINSYNFNMLQFFQDESTCRKREYFFVDNDASFTFNALPIEFTVIGEVINFDLVTGQEIDTLYGNCVYNGNFTEPTDIDCININSN